MDPGQVLGELQRLVIQVTGIANVLFPFAHPNLVVRSMLQDGVGLILNVWFRFILQTTDFETTRDFTANATIQAFEPKVQIVANAALALMAVWASYRIMWGHGLRSLYTARILLPRLFMSVVLVNFALPLMQALIDASNVVSRAVYAFGTIPDMHDWWNAIGLESIADLPQIFTTGALVAGYEVLAVVYVIRYTILVVLAITAPLAGLLFTLPDTHHMAKQWGSLFMTNLLMQPAQLFVLAIGFAIEKNGATPVHHLFALATLLVLFKVPGAMGGSEKVARRRPGAAATCRHRPGRGRDVALRLHVVRAGAVRSLLPGPARPHRRRPRRAGGHPGDGGRRGHRTGGVRSRRCWHLRGRNGRPARAAALRPPLARAYHRRSTGDAW